MAPAKKKRKTAAEPEKYLCHSCLATRAAGTFPDYNPSVDCEHLINTCKTCLKKWVQVCVGEGDCSTSDDGKVFGVRCPQCPALMRSVNVELGSTKKVFERFEELERKHIADSTPGWRWCMAPSCREGQVHAPAAAPEDPQRPKLQKGFSDFIHGTEPAAPDVPRICKCHACGAEACVVCDRPWHGGETCEQYQDRIKDRVAEEDRTVEMIARISKSCPSCHRKIQKNGGCSNMVCTQCNASFCWLCEGLHVKGSCKCRRA